MEFTFDTDYDLRAMTALARTMRKTVRKRRSRLSHIFGWIVAVLGLLLSLPLDGSFSAVNVILLLPVLVILAVLLWEDRLNAWFALKRQMPGMAHSHTVFRDEGYLASTGAGTTEFPYSGNITALAETGDYLVFLLGNYHGQLYDKRSISGGSLDAFRDFLQAKTGLEIRPVR